MTDTAPRKHQDTDTRRTAKLLRQTGLRSTRQRLALGALLFEGEDRHVTAELLHAEAVAIGHYVSLATVYNTLHQFKRAGLLRELGINGAKAYFDTNTSNHNHFFFESEEELHNIPDNAIHVEGVPEPPEGTEISHIDVVVRVVTKGTTATSQQTPTVKVVANPSKGDGMPESVQEAVRTHLDHGRACLNKGKYDDAIADYDKAIALAPNDAIAYSDRGVAYARRGEVDRAIADFYAAIALDPNFAIAYTNRGIAYGRKVAFVRAIEDYDKAIALAPNDAIAYYNRGVAYYEKGDKEQAIADFRKALEIDPSDQDAKEGLKHLGVTP